MRRNENKGIDASYKLKHITVKSIDVVCYIFMYFY